MCAHCRDRAVDTSEAVPEIMVYGFCCRFCLMLIKGYQYFLSPLFPPSCRYTPTCSEYAAEAVVKYGAIRGIWLAACRILRCHPFVRGGYDPVK